MKAIVAFIKPFKEEKVCRALHEVGGLSGATFSDSRGFGRGRGHTHDVEQEALVGTLKRVRLEVMVPDQLAERVAQVIAKAAHTGNHGDGKVYIFSIESALRIRTGESGESAV